MGPRPCGRGPIAGAACQGAGRTVECWGGGATMIGVPRAGDGSRGGFGSATCRVCGDTAERPSRRSNCSTDTDAAAGRRTRIRAVWPSEWSRLVSSATVRARYGAIGAQSCAVRSDTDPRFSFQNLNCGDQLTITPRQRNNSCQYSVRAETTPSREWCRGTLRTRQERHAVVLVRLRQPGLDLTACYRCGQDCGAT